MEGWRLKGEWATRKIYLLGRRLAPRAGREKKKKEKSQRIVQKSLTLEFARKKQWVRKEKVPGLSVSERTNPTLYAEGTR
jgi:hypothetical protein